MKKNLAVVFPIKDFDHSVTTTLASLAAQEKINLTCIAVAERHVLDKLGADASQLRILNVERPARGVYNALNAGLDTARSLAEFDAVAFISSGALLAERDSLFDLANLTMSDGWAVGAWRQAYHSRQDRTFHPPIARGSGAGLAKLRHFSSYWPLNIEALVLGSKLAETVRFDESKKIGADFKLFATLLAQSSSALVSQSVHVILPAPGLSSQQIRLGQRDIANARFEVAKSVNSPFRRRLLWVFSHALLVFEIVLNSASSIRATLNGK